MIPPIAAWYLTRRRRSEEDDDRWCGSLLDMTGRDWLISIAYGVGFFLLFAALPMWWITR